MHHFLSRDLIPTQSEAKTSMGARQSSSPLDDPVANGCRLIEYPQGRAFGRRLAVGLSRSHLKFSIQVMGKHGREEIQLVA
jgi:hypothetical protein